MSNEHSIQYRIFNKSQDLVEYWEDKIGSELDEDMELWGFFDTDKETLKL